MEKTENILIIESECEIIKPTIIKNKYKNHLSFEPKKNTKLNNEDTKENTKDDINNIIKNINDSIIINIESDNNRKNHPILEILNILNTPIDPNFKDRYIPNKIDLYFFNNEFERNLKYINDININN